MQKLVFDIVIVGFSGLHYMRVLWFENGSFSGCYGCGPRYIA